MPLAHFVRFFVALAIMFVARAAIAQPTIQFPNTPAASGSFQTSPGTPSGAVTPVNPYTGGAVPFDPYSQSGSAAYSFWSTNPPSNVAGPFAQPPTSPYGATTPIAPGVPVSPYAGGVVAPAGPPQAIYPNGIATTTQFDFSQTLRFIQDLRIRETWVAGGDDDRDVDINDIETAVTFTFPNFLTTGQPLFVSPAFALHLWDGPAGIDADLPSKAYSAYLDFQWASDPQYQIGAELGFRVGVFTDFNTLNDDSLRLQGLGLATARLTPTLVAKAGAMYIDRNDVKILPAGGVLWTPTPQVRFDIFFPQPKLAMYMTTIGQVEFWGYVTGEYGGGAWTIERDDGTSDRVDINDIRIGSGLEWTGPRGVTGFFESGIVFEREVVYVVDPSDSFHPPDTFYARFGLSF